MDAATKQMVLGIASGALRKLAIAIAAGLTTHGIAVTGSFTETFVSAGIGLGVWAYSTYGDYVKVIVLSQLQVLKAKSLAQAAKLDAHSIAPPTPIEIAAHSDTVTPAQVVKATAATGA